LRGPQGTLYGASSQSGTLRIITSKPDPSKLESWFNAELTSAHDGGDGYDVSAMINVPLADDRVALRLVGFTSRDAGFIDNVLLPSQGDTFDNANVVKKDVNEIDTTGGRAALGLKITDDFSATLSAVFQDVSGNGHSDVNEGAGDLNQVRFEKENLRDNWYQVALTLDANLPFGHGVLAASYFNRDFRYEADATDYEFQFNQVAINCVPTADTPCTPAYDFGGDPRGFAKNKEETEITTIEARLSSPGGTESRWGWLVGAFYSEEKGKTAFDSFVRGYENTPSFAYFNYYEMGLTEDGTGLDPTETWFLGRYDTELDQFAVFGELSFDLTENFTITAGGRYFDYDRKFAQIQEQPEGFTGASRLDSTQKTSEDGTVWKLNATYKFDQDLLVYATYSEGFRVGGANPLKGSTVLPRIYDSDTLTNYEVGAKTEWLNHRVRLNVSAYYMKWDDFAVQIEDPQPLVFQLGYVNLASAEIKGFEAEFAVTFNQYWQLDGSLAYNHAETSKATSFSFTNEDGDTFAFDVPKGSRLPLSPDWSGALGIEFRPGGMVMNGQPYIRFDYSYVGESVNSLEGIESVVSSQPVDTQAAYQIGDLRFGVDGDHWGASIFINNLWDERADLFRSNRWGGSPERLNSPVAVQRRSVNAPRTLGIQLRYTF
jgi:outer membrane receptor protein involved in Fe transport